MTYETEKCSKCGKVLIGFSRKDLKWRMSMHDLGHRHEEEMAEEKLKEEEEKKNGNE